jgi:hypothetical protein
VEQEMRKQQQTNRRDKKNGMLLNKKNIQRGCMSKRIQRNKTKRTNWWGKMTTVFNLWSILLY